MLRRVMAVNFFGAARCTQAALPSLLQRRGQIVVISSVAGFSPLVGRSAYAASKACAARFLRQPAQRLSRPTAWRDAGLPGLHRHRHRTMPRSAPMPADAGTAPDQRPRSDTGRRGRTHPRRRTAWSSPSACLRAPAPRLVAEPSRPGVLRAPDAAPPGREFDHATEPCMSARLFTSLLMVLAAAPPRRHAQRRRRKRRAARHRDGARDAGHARASHDTRDGGYPLPAQPFVVETDVTASPTPPAACASTIAAAPCACWCANRLARSGHRTRAGPCRSPRGAAARDRCAKRAEALPANAPAGCARSR